MKKQMILVTALALMTAGLLMAQAEKDPEHIGERNGPPQAFVPFGSGYCNQPGAAIPDNTPSGLTDNLSIPGSFALIDADVTLNVTHTWVGDLAFTVTSPMGTSVTIVDQPGEPASTFGCSGDDINATLDDEAGAPVETACSAAIPAIGGSFTPNNPLSAFDGEDAQGMWTITVVDNAGGDTGTLNEWCVVTDPVPVELQHFSID